MIKLIFDILPFQLENFPKEDALCAKENDVWKKYSTQEACNLAEQFALGLLELGLKKGDKIGIVSNNRPEWNIADLGMLQAGIVNVPVYTTLSEAETTFVFNDSQVSMVLVSDEELYKKLQSIKANIPSLRDVVTFNKVPGARHWSEIVLKGSASHRKEELKLMKQSIQPDDLATLIYTSGTTGNPKGVMLSHNNIVSNVVDCRALAPAGPQHKALSFLPLCHSYERLLTYWYMSKGTSIYYAESMDKIIDNIKEIKPNFFSAVPRLLEKVYDKILEKGKTLTGLKKVLFFWAVNLGLRYELGNANGSFYNFQLRLARKLIFSKWQEALGGNVIAIISGGAALQPRLSRVFNAAGIVVLEGYGLTETSPVIAVNNFEPDSIRFGTVGTVIRNVSVKIAEDGEILCKGPNVMLGYYNRPDLTKEVIDKDGWFHTGDIGEMVENRFLKITDRKKEIFKTSGGKYIAPQAIENKFKESLFIEQIMVIGENRKFPAALIVPSFAFLDSWCKLKQIKSGAPEEMIINQHVTDRIAEEVEELNQSLGHFEQIKEFRLLPKEWTVQSGELTPTLKLKRKVIMERNKDLIESIYKD
jgi:long-chain acyl-CoA synthetase